jgi:hypothetical protein
MTIRVSKTHKQLQNNFSKNLVKDIKKKTGSSFKPFHKCRNNFCKKESDNFVKDMKNLSKKLSKKKSGNKHISKKKFMKEINNYFSKLSKKKSSKDLEECLKVNCNKETKLYKKKSLLP